MKVIAAGLVGLAVLGNGACADRSASPTDSAAVQPAANVAVAGADVVRTGFGFSGTVGTVVTLTGGGSFAGASASDVVPSDTDVGAGGGFRCDAPVAQGPLAGCAEGEGVRWEAVQLLATTGFRCSGADPVKTVATADGTVVLLADFFRASDGREASFSARLIVSRVDIAPDVAGNQFVWVQGVGCGDASVRFSR